jgi:anastral spindle 1
MERVRQEKLKLIENSLSSGEFNNFTEYKEIVIDSKEKESDQKDSPSQREDPPSEEIKNILQRQTRPFGVSKDSGISMSRPVTSSDIRDSPDVRITSEEKENVFQPITFKESTKGLRVKIMAEGDQKKAKPPLSLKSFSPQIEKQHEPHELSTIAEIETPSASKVNLITDDLAMSGLHSFPHFEEYAKQLGISNLEQSTTFPDISALPDMHIQTFPGPHEYEIPNISKTIEDGGSNNSSLMDIAEELKKRNFYKTSVECVKDDTNTSKTTPVTATQQKIAPNSPRKQGAKTRIIVNTPDNADNMQLQVIHTPTKKKPELPANILPQSESLKSNDTLSGIQEIENDASLNWAANLVKKTRESKRVNDTVSSSGKESIQIEIEIASSSSSSPTNGRPLNLRDFLRRELLTTKNNNDKLISDDSSFSSHFMKSLINTTSSSSSDSSRNGDSKKLRTSTPVHNITNVDRVAVKSAVSSQLFVGESVSTLRDSGSSQAS